MKASVLFVNALENEGVEYIFGIPGEENLDMLDALKDSNIKLILTRHEQGAGFMAATYGRLTGKVGVCLATLGPGATNLVTPAAYANLGAMPMLMITGQKPIKSSKQGQFQIVDIVAMMKPLTKLTKQIVNGNTIPSLVRDAIKKAESERPGAVHLELPEDIAREECEEKFYHIHHTRYPCADMTTIEDAIKLIEQAKHPLLLIGAGANRKRIGTALLDFVNKTKIPFFSTQMGKGVIDERHELNLGTAALSKDDYIHCAIEYADLIINVGHDIIEKPPFFMEIGGKKVIHINFLASDIDDTYFPQLDVLGDISHNINNITVNIEMQKGWNFDYFKKVNLNVEEHLSKYSHDARFPILPQTAVQIIRDALPSDGIVTLDNGVYKIWFARNYQCHESNTLLLDNALATMGAGLASAMLAKLIYPEKKVISVSGDGGFMMNAQELETAVRLGLDLVVIILNDSAYGMIKWKQEGMGFDNFGLDYNNPNFVTHADSYGAIGHRPDSVKSFESILKECLDSKGVHLIDLPVNYDLNHAILNELHLNNQCLIGA